MEFINILQKRIEILQSENNWWEGLNAIKNILNTNYYKYTYARTLKKVNIIYLHFALYNEVIHSTSV